MASSWVRISGKPSDLGPLWHGRERPGVKPHLAGRLNFQKLLPSVFSSLLEVSILLLIFSYPIFLLIPQEHCLVHSDCKQEYIENVFRTMGKLSCTPTVPAAEPISICLTSPWEKGEWGGAT